MGLSLLAAGYLVVYQAIVFVRVDTVKGCSAPLLNLILALFLPNLLIRIFFLQKLLDQIIQNRRCLSITVHNSSTSDSCW